MPEADDPIAEYHMGQEIVMSGDFTDETTDPPTAGDPDVVQLLYQEGDEAQTQATVVMGALTNPSVGRWEYRYTVPKDGNKAIRPWRYRFEGASAPGGITAVNQRRFYVIPSPFYPPT
jgi:hypothetical protein